MERDSQPARAGEAARGPQADGERRRGIEGTGELAEPFEGWPAMPPSDESSDSDSDSDSDSATASEEHLGQEAAAAGWERALRVAALSALDSPDFAGSGAPSDGGSTAEDSFKDEVRRELQARGFAEAERGSEQERERGTDGPMPGALSSAALAVSTVSTVGLYEGGEPVAVVEEVPGKCMGLLQLLDNAVAMLQAEVLRHRRLRTQLQRHEQQEELTGEQALLTSLTGAVTELETVGVRVDEAKERLSAVIALLAAAAAGRGEAADAACTVSGAMGAAADDCDEGDSDEDEHQEATAAEELAREEEEEEEGEKEEEVAVAVPACVEEEDEDRPVANEAVAAS